MFKTTLKTLAAIGIAAGLSIGTAHAEYPEKPIQLVIPLGAGGSHDLNARVITSIIPAYLNQAMIVQLTPGASGQKGTQAVATANAGIVRTRSPNDESPRSRIQSRAF